MRHCPRRAHRSLRSGDRVCRVADRQGQLGARGSDEFAGGSAIRRAPSRHSRAGSAAAPRGIYLRRLSQPGRLRRNEEHSGNRDHGAVCLRHGGVRGQAYPIGDPAPLPQRRRCDCDYSSLRMRDCDRCSRLGDSHSHAAQLEFESQPRRSAHGGKPGLRKTAAFANAAGKHPPHPLPPSWRWRKSA